MNVCAKERRHQQHQCNSKHYVNLCLKGFLISFVLVADDDKNNNYCMPTHPHSLKKLMIITVQPFMFKKKCITPYSLWWCAWVAVIHAMSNICPLELRDSESRSWHPMFSNIFAPVNLRIPVWGSTSSTLQQCWIHTPAVLDESNICMYCTHRVCCMDLPGGSKYCSGMIHGPPS